MFVSKWLLNVVKGVNQQETGLIPTLSKMLLNVDGVRRVLNPSVVASAC